MAKRGINYAKRINGIKNDLDDIVSSIQEQLNSKNDIEEKKIKLSDIDIESCETELLTELQLKIAKTLVSRMKGKE